MDRNHWREEGEVCVCGWVADGTQDTQLRQKRELNGGGRSFTVRVLRYRG